MTIKDKIGELIITCGYIGKSKYAPGTLGAFCAFPLIYLTINFIPFSLLNINYVSDILLAYAATIILLWLILFILGYYFSNNYIKQKNLEDPQEIIIDELTGQILTLILCSANLPMTMHISLNKYIGEQWVNIIFFFILPFSLFRIFDIIKPWPIDWLDHNIKGGFGIMLDDQIAAIFAAVINYVVLFSIINFLP